MQKVLFCVIVVIAADVDVVVIVFAFGYYLAGGANCVLVVFLTSVQVYACCRLFPLK